MTRALCLALLLFACGSCSKNAGRSLSDPSGFENEIGAVVIERLIQETREFYSDESEPPPYALVVGERLAPTSPAFLQRFRDLGHTFLSSNELDYDRVTKATVIKGTRDNPIVLHLAKLTQIAEGQHEVATAWNRNTKVVRKLYKVEGDPKTDPLTVTEAEPAPEGG